MQWHLLKSAFLAITRKTEMKNRCMWENDECFSTKNYTTKIFAGNIAWLMVQYSTSTVLYIGCEEFIDVWLRNGLSAIYFFILYFSEVLHFLLKGFFEYGLQIAIYLFFFVICVSGHVRFHL